MPKPFDEFNDEASSQEFVWKVMLRWAVSHPPQHYFLEGAIQYFWGFKATFFVYIELRICNTNRFRKIYFPHFLTSMFTNKDVLKPLNSSIAPSIVSTYRLNQRFGCLELILASNFFSLIWSQFFDKTVLLESLDK